MRRIISISSSDSAYTGLSSANITKQIAKKIISVSNVFSAGLGPELSFRHNVKIATTIADRKIG